MVAQPGGAVTFTKEITGGAPWVLRAISSDISSGSLVGVRCQIQLPNGRFLFGQNGVDIGQFAWVGSWRFPIEPEIRCEPGGKIQVTLTDTTPGNLASAVAVNLVFEGAFLYFMRGGERVPDSQYLASSLPRYQGIVNENILCPAWMSNEALHTPEGYLDENYAYSTPDPDDEPAQTTWTITAGVVTGFPVPMPFEIQIPPGYDFFVRRILTDIAITGDVFAVVLGKLRTGAGYVLNNNLIDISRYFGAVEFGGLWKIAGGDSVFIDENLVDVTGTGTLTKQVYLEGYRRSKR